MSNTAKNTFFIILPLIFLFTLVFFTSRVEQRERVERLEKIKLSEARLRAEAKIYAKKLEQRLEQGDNEGIYRASMDISKASGEIIAQNTSKYDIAEEVSEKASENASKNADDELAELTEAEISRIEEKAKKEELISEERDDTFGVDSKTKTAIDELESIVEEMYK